MKTLAVGVFAVVLSTVGCAGDVSSPPVSTAAARLRDPARYMFVLDESTVRTTVAAKCAKDAPGAEDACLARIREAGSREGMTFATDASGRVILRSFGYDEAGKEEVFAEAPMTVEDVAPNVVRLTTPISSTGTHPWSEGMSSTVTWLDDRTFAMEEGARGRFVYRK